MNGIKNGIEGKEWNQIEWNGIKWKEWNDEYE